MTKEKFKFDQKVFFMSFIFNSYASINRTRNQALSPGFIYYTGEIKAITEFKDGRVEYIVNATRCDIWGREIGGLKNNYLAAQDYCFGSIEELKDGVMKEVKK